MIGMDWNTQNSVCAFNQPFIGDKPDRANDLRTNDLGLFAAGGENAQAMGIMASPRNLELPTVTSSGLPELAWLYFAVAQFLIYFPLWLLRPVISNLKEKDSRPCPPVGKI